MPFSAMSMYVCWELLHINLCYSIVDVLITVIKPIPIYYDNFLVKNPALLNNK